MGSGSGRVVDLAANLTSSTLSSIIAPARFPFVTIAVWTPGFGSNSRSAIVRMLCSSHALYNIESVDGCVLDEFFIAPTDR